MELNIGMTYNQIMNKIDRVFDSCENREQINVGIVYCRRLINKFFMIIPEEEILIKRALLFNYLKKTAFRKCNEN